MRKVVVVVIVVSVTLSKIFSSQMNLLSAWLHCVSRAFNQQLQDSSFPSGRPKKTPCTHGGIPLLHEHNATVQPASSFTRAALHRCSLDKFSSTDP